MEGERKITPSALKRVKVSASQSPPSEPSREVSPVQASQALASVKALRERLTSAKHVKEEKAVKKRTRAKKAAKTEKVRDVPQEPQHDEDDDHEEALRRHRAMHESSVMDFSEMRDALDSMRTDFDVRTSEIAAVVARVAGLEHDVHERIDELERRHGEEVESIINFLEEIVSAIEQN